MTFNKRKSVTTASTKNLLAPAKTIEKSNLKFPEIDLFYGDRKKFQTYVIHVDASSHIRLSALHFALHIIDLGAP